MSTQAAVITFDAVVSGATSFGFDGDGDSVDDVLFTTGDPGGFNTVGPGPNMTFIAEPGIEGTTTLAEDLRVDFINGAGGTLAFGMALCCDTDPASFTPGVNFIDFTVFDSSNNIIASTNVAANFTSTPQGSSSFPEAFVAVSFAGNASHAIFDFNSSGGRYIIDNFEGNFGSTEEIIVFETPPDLPDTPGGGAVPEPQSIVLLCGALLIAGLKKKK